MTDPERVEVGGGLQLAVTRSAPAGRGRGRILLVHGLAGGRIDFLDWLAPLAAAGWEAAAYDQRGHGESGREAGEEKFSLSLFGDDVLAVADALSWDRFVLVGHSVGGMVAQLVALASPRRLTGLVLMSTSAGPPAGLAPDLLHLGQDLVRAGGMAALLAAQKASGPGPLDSPAHQRLLERRPGWAESGDRKTLSASPDMWVAIIGELLTQPDRSAALSGLRVPTLVVVGEEDRTFLGPCQHLAEVIPDACIAVLEEAGHSPQVEAPERWWAVVEPFLTGLVPGVPIVPTAEVAT